MVQVDLQGYTEGIRDGREYAVNQIDKGIEKIMESLTKCTGSAAGAKKRGMLAAVKIMKEIREEVEPE